MSKATETRKLTDLMRSIHRAGQPYGYLFHASTGVTLDRRYGRRRYMLEYTQFSPSGVAYRAGTYVLLDATERTLHVRPAERIVQFPVDPLEPLFQAWSFRHGYLRALIVDALAAGYTLDRWSETLETLDTAASSYWRQEFAS